MTDDKLCPRCQEIKAIEDFVKDRRKESGRGAICKPCKNAYNSEWRMSNRTAVLASEKAWRDKNPAKTKRYRRKYYEGHKDSIAKYNSKWADENPDRRKEHHKRWVVSNPGKRGEYKRSRRARQYGARQGAFMPTPLQLSMMYGANCLVPECESSDTTIDHVIPLSKGGDHGIWNFQPLCHSHNSSKGVNVIDYRSIVYTDDEAIEWVKSR